MIAEKRSDVSLRDVVASVAGPRQWSDTRQSWLNRAARRSHLNYRTVKAIFYGELTNASHPAAQQLIATARQIGGSKARDIAQEFEIVAGALRVSDADFHQQDIAALVAAAKQLRGLDRT